MKYLHHFIDGTSIKLFSTTLLGGFFANIFKGGSLGTIALLFTCLAGLTTGVYNAIRIYKEIKNK